MKKCPLCNSDHVQIHKAYSQDCIERFYKTDPLFNGRDIDISQDVTSHVDLYQCSRCELKFYLPLYTGGSSFYNQLQAFPWYYQLHKPEFDYAKSYIQSTDSVLEIGCGAGHFASLIEGTYTGLDPYSQNPKVIKESIHLHQGTYDVVCGFQVLEHVTDPKEFIQSALGFLKPNGLLILSVPSEDSFLGNIDGWALNYPPHHVTRYTNQCLENIATLFNLECVALYNEPLAEFHRSLLDDNKYPFINNNIDYDIGHTVIAVYRKNQ